MNGTRKTVREGKPVVVDDSGFWLPLLPWKPDDKGERRLRVTRDPVKLSATPPRYHGNQGPRPEKTDP